MRAIRWMLTFVLIFAAACSSRASDATGGSDPAVGGFDEADMLRPDAPLRGLALTRHIGRSDPAIRPTLAFTSDDTVATAVIGLGNVPEGSALTVTWYRLTGIDERDLLFSQEIAVGPGGRAYSQGIAAGGLTPGTYDTVATMDDHLVHTPWMVQEAKAAPAAASAQAASGDESWDVPESGDSGWYAPDTPPGPPAPPGPCEVDAIHPGFDPLTDVMASVFWIGQCSHMALTATISGAPQEVASTEVTEASLSFLPGRADLCDLPGRSDLPGTVVKWAATGSEGATGSATFTVPDFGETLEAFVQAATDTPSRVDPGYRIELRGMAVVMPPALGIKELSLLAGGELIQTVGNASGTAAPQPCDFGRYGAVNRSSYTVPSDPPPVIEICAEALGFDGTESRNCINFHTGEVWEGEVTGQTTQPGCSPARTPVTGNLILRVESDGTVTGSVTEIRPPFSCGGTGVPTSRVTGEISGRKTAAAFEISASGTPITLPITGTRATATFDNEGTGGYASEVIYTVECVTCAVGL